MTTLLRSPGSRELDIVLFEALAKSVEADTARAALDEALASEGMTQVPRDPAALRFFVTGVLKRTIGSEVEFDWLDTVVDAAARLGERSPGRRPVTHERPVRGTGRWTVAALTVDADFTARLEARLPLDSEVTQAASLFDLDPLLGIGPHQSAALVVDVPLTPVPLTTLGRMAHVIPMGCQVRLVGVRAVDHTRLAALFPRSGEWAACETLSDINLASAARR